MEEIKSMFSLEGKLALITGGSRGLGREMALAFAKAGSDVIITSRKLENCEKVASEVEAIGRKAFPYSTHVGRWDQIDELVEDVYKNIGEIDILVNNAGMSPLYDSLVNVNEKLFDSVINVNLKGPFRLSSLVGTRMAEKNGGNIINVSSFAAVNPTPGEVPYAAAKAGINSMTAALAQAFSPKVRVNCIMAGPFLTDISKAWGDDEQIKQRFINNGGLRRAGNPEEIIGTALYLASEASSYTTGAVIAVDGGLKR